MASLTVGSTRPVTATEGLEGFIKAIRTYEHRVGHACREVASYLPALLAPAIPPNGGVVLDNACGTGAATEELLKVFPNVEIYAADIGSQMVDSFREVINASSLLKAQVKDLRVEDGQALTYPDDMFDGSITNFGIFFFPDPVAGTKQIYRTLKTGGIAVLTLWCVFGFKPILWEVQKRIMPSVPLVELPIMEPWCDPAKLEGVLKEGGFTKVSFSSVQVGMWGKNREDFETVLVENFAAMVSRDWVEEEKAKLASTTLQVLDEMQDEFCITDGEKVGCVMEAWVAVCSK